RPGDAGVVDAGRVDAGGPRTPAPVDAAVADASPPPLAPFDAPVQVDAGLLGPRDAGIPIYDAGRSARPRFDGGVTPPRPTPAAGDEPATSPPAPAVGSDVDDVLDDPR
ncbi:MAG TPA: hypothetical protein VHE35_36045, partial [Kofleriaceae bacterium]|nr:hypothetical protein [Kofleriaceae bacterium]